MKKLKANLTNNSRNGQIIIFNTPTNQLGLPLYSYSKDINVFFKCRKP
jgi:hypothetical protein